MKSLKIAKASLFATALIIAQPALADTRSAQALPATAGITAIGAPRMASPIARSNEKLGDGSMLLAIPAFATLITLLVLINHNSHKELPISPG